MSKAAEIARAFRGHRSGDGFLVRCPVAGHGNGKGDRNPSLLVKDGHSQLLVKCFAGCASADVLSALRKRGLANIDSTLTAHNSPVGGATHHRDIRLVRHIWSTSAPLIGAAEAYLRRHRGLSPPFAPSLRSSADHHAPALVAAASRSDNAIVAVQITYLDTSGRKASVSPVRRTVGALGDGAVRLGDISDRLGLAEGVEDSLAASQLSGIPCWACLGAGRMHRVSIPREVREIHLFADDDEPGRAAAERTADHHRKLGRRVVLRLPPAGFKDWGEVAQHPREAA